MTKTEGLEVYTYYNCCVGWDSRDVHRKGGLVEMIDNNIEITRSTFLKHVDREQLAEMEREMGYSRSTLTMASDWHVTYHRSKLHGKRCYYFRHSAIEYVFTNEGDNQ